MTIDIEEVNIYKNIYMKREKMLLLGPWLPEDESCVNDPKFGSDASGKRRNEWFLAARKETKRKPGVQLYIFTLTSLKKQTNNWSLAMLRNSLSNFFKHPGIFFFFFPQFCCFVFFVSFLEQPKCCEPLWLLTKGSQHGFNVDLRQKKTKQKNEKWIFRSLPQSFSVRMQNVPLFFFFFICF